MRKYVIVNISNSIAEQIMQWGDDRDFPSNIPLSESDKLITVDSNVDVQYGDIYNEITNEFYVLEISDNILELSILKMELGNYNSILSDFQEEIFRVNNVDESKLEPIWQERLAYKRDLRSRILALEELV